jgi:hypothetical protein
VTQILYSLTPPPLLSNTTALSLMAENTEGEEETEKEEFAIMYSITVVSQCCYNGIAVVLQ